MSNTIFWDANSTAGSGQIWSTAVESTATQQTHSWIDRWETVVDSNSNATVPWTEHIGTVHGIDTEGSPIDEISPLSPTFNFRHDFGRGIHKSDLLKYMMGDWEEQEDVNKKVHDIFKQAMKN